MFLYIKCRRQISNILILLSKRLFQKYTIYMKNTFTLRITFYDWRGIYIRTLVVIVYFVDFFAYCFLGKISFYISYT